MKYRERAMNAVGIIPARLSSTRFPGKLLKEIKDKPLLQYTYENAKRSERLSEVIIATEDDEIIESAKKFNAKVVKTPDNFQSGTDRIAWAYRELGLSDDLVFNIQGDEPLLDPKIIDELFVRFSTSLCDVGTLVKRIGNEEELEDPNIVKVVRGIDGNALYFSRSPIPYYRDNSENYLKEHTYWKHIGLYAYRVEALEKFSELPQTDLEIAEKLEQLRLLQNNVKYFCLEVKNDIIGVDTEEDLKKIRSLF